jgi:hypothetical protein
MNGWRELERDTTPVLGGLCMHALPAHTRAENGGKRERSDDSYLTTMFNEEYDAVSLQRAHIRTRTFQFNNFDYFNEDEFIKPITSSSSHSNQKR